MEPIWLQKKALLAIHNRLIAEFGGSTGLRDEGLLESALAKPKNIYEYENKSLPVLAASYAFGIIKNHPFVDGNKRVALVACELFLRINNKTIKASQAEKYQIFFQLAASKIDEKKLIEWTIEYTF